MTAAPADKSGQPQPELGLELRPELRPCSLEALAALLQAGLPPEQALQEWSQPDGPNNDPSSETISESSPENGRANIRANIRALGRQSGLARLFATALLQANPKARALLDTPQDLHSQGDTIAQAYAELAALTKHAAQAQQERALAQATLAGERRRIAMAEDLARDRETILGAAVLSLSAAQSESDAPRGPAE